MQGAGSAPMYTGVKQEGSAGNQHCYTDVKPGKGRSESDYFLGFPMPRRDLNK